MILNNYVVISNNITGAHYKNTQVSVVADISISRLVSKRMHANISIACTFFTSEIVPKMDHFFFSTFEHRGHLLRVYLRPKRVQLEPTSDHLKAQLQTNFKPTSHQVSHHLSLKL
ncbi:hypothetical protein BDC45DRAFT_536289 [Circinella umbellata]|nr:hypothetical protein BDC45DRAFT_536289 [Circinella umbellata]